MTNLERSHPQLHQQLTDNPGIWTFQHHSNAGFTSMAADQTIETTINRESKTSGGIKGITLSRGGW